MEKNRISELYEHYQHTLFDDVIPFWLKHAIDRKYGGYHTFLDRDGSVYDTDKGMWMISRGVWMFSKLYNTVEKRFEWLEAARSGYDFLIKYGFNAVGRMFYSVTCNGRPLRKRRYLFTEIFGVLACAEFARAADSATALRKAKDTFRLVISHYRNPSSRLPKVFPQTRVTKSHAMPMILLATSMELSQIDSDPLYNEVINNALDEILNHFLKPDLHALLETVGPNGELLNSPEGRCINPGHAIETSRLILHAAHYRKDNSLVKKALDILNWSFEWGWDEKYGGLLSYVDLEGKPPAHLEWDMKLWWPHTEALYALLLAYSITKDKKYFDRFEKVHRWAFDHFPDPEHGEWFGYLHRDGSVSLSLKGSMWKGAFHLPRALLQCMKLLKKLEQS